MVDLLRQVAVHAPRAVVAICCLRILHQLAESKEATRRVGVTPVISTLIQTLKPLHSDAGFTLEVMKRLLEQDTVVHVPMADPTMDGGAGAAGGGGQTAKSAIVGQAMRTDVNVIRFLAGILVSPQRQAACFHLHLLLRPPPSV